MRGRLTLGPTRPAAAQLCRVVTQDALAGAAGIGRVTLVRLEKGEQTPRFKTLEAVARALGVGVLELVVEPEFLQPMTGARRSDTF